MYLLPLDAAIQYTTLCRVPRREREVPLARSQPSSTLEASSGSSSQQRLVSSGATCATTQIYRIWITFAHCGIGDMKGETRAERLSFLVNFQMDRLFSSLLLLLLSWCTRTYIQWLFKGCCLHFAWCTLPFCHFSSIMFHWRMFVLVSFNIYLWLL